MFKKFKQKLGIRLSHYPKLWNFSLTINGILFHWDKRQHDKSFGSLNPSLRFYVVRPRGVREGLLSMYFFVLDELKKAFSQGFIPIVDWQNYETQYNVDFPVNGTRNAWEYYFEQPSKYTLDEVYQSRNVRLSGWVLWNVTATNATQSPFTLSPFKRTEIMPVKKYVKDLAEEKISSDRIDDMIGVLARGTDYTKLKPGQHPVAPSPEMLSEKLDEFLKQYGERKIFLATEDANVYSFFKKKYGDLIYTTDQERNLVEQYSGQYYLAQELNVENMYKFGLDYIVKMICLSRCKYLIAANTAGSRFARLFNNGHYADEYVFDLGMY